MMFQKSWAQNYGNFLSKTRDYMMKNILHILMLHLAFALISQANAADLSNKLTASPITDSGWYVSVHATSGKLAITDFTQSDQADNAGQEAYPINTTISQKTTRGGGITVGYQYSQINNNLVRSLQVKRISYGLEIDKTSSHLQGDVNYVDQLATMNADYDSSALMATAKVNVFQVWHFSPYIEAGIGGMRQSLSQYEANYSTGVTTYPNTSNTGLAYQAGIGMDVLVTEHIDASIGYRYLHAKLITVSNQTSMGKLENSSDLNTNQNQWIASIAYNF